MHFLRQIVFIEIPETKRTRKITSWFSFLRVPLNWWSIICGKVERSRNVHHEFCPKPIIDAQRKKDSSLTGGGQARRTHRKTVTDLLPSFCLWAFGSLDLLSMLAYKSRVREKRNPVSQLSMIQRGMKRTLILIFISHTFRYVQFSTCFLHRSIIKIVLPLRKRIAIKADLFR